MAICLWVLALLATFHGVVLSYPLIVKPVDTHSKLGQDQIFRKYTFYSTSNGPSIDFSCSLPSWFNETALGKAKVYWKDNDEKNILNINPKTTETREFVCVARNIDNKAFDGWDDTTLNYNRSDESQISIVPPARSVLNYSSGAEPLVLECKTDKSPVLWFLDGRKLNEATDKHIRIHINNTLVVRHPSHVDVGVYVCKVEANEKLFAFHSIEGPPYFALKHSKNEDSENKLEGESVTLKHELFGNPLHDEMKWYKQTDDDDQEVEITENDIKMDPRIHAYSDLNVNNGILELTDLKKDDRAYYISKMFNNHGNSTFKTLVRVKGRLDALWPFLGIVAEVIILVAIILIYERRRMKRDREADEAVDQKKPLTNANSDNVRQRKN